MDTQMAEISTSGSNGDQDHRPHVEFPLEVPSGTPDSSAENETDLESETVEISSHSELGGGRAKIQLPRYLERAPFKQISSAALEAIDPDLKLVAQEFILDSLTVLGPRLHNVLATSVVDTPRERSQIPWELEVVINNSADAPTHIFSIRAESTRQVAFYPVHAIIFATQCARLSPFPHSKPIIPAEAGGRLTLPVLPLSMPSPATFPIIRDYLYTRSVDCVYDALLPILLRNLLPPVNQLSRTLAITFKANVLISCMKTVHGLWRNVERLGVFDEKLLQAMEMSWEVLWSALVKPWAL